MISFRINTRGINKTIKSLKNKSKKLTNSMHSIYEESSKNIYHRSRALARVRTGKMRNHIRVKIIRKTNVNIIIIIYNDVRNKQNVNYSKFIEFGTVKMRAYPFLFPALEYEKPVLKSRLRRMLRKL